LENKLSVYLDLDGTILNTDVCMSEWYNLKFRNHPDFKVAIPEKIYFWDAKIQMPLMTQQDWYDLFASNFFFENVTIKKNCKEVIKRMYDSKNFEIFFCSIGNKDNVRKKHKWLKENFPFINEDHYILIERENCEMGKNKYIPKDALLLDDNIENLSSLAKYNVLFKDCGEKFYNRLFDGTIVDNWLDFEKLVNGIISDNIRTCYICGRREDKFKLYRTSKYGDNICVKHHAQMIKYGTILSKTCFDLNEIIIKDDYAEIIILDKGNGKIKCKAKIDLDSVEKISKFKWCVGVNGYIICRSNKNIIRLHHLVLQPIDGFVIDHINRDKSDNRIMNLRYATRAENGWNINVGKNNRSGTTGVFWYEKRGKWQVYIKVLGKRKHLGYFNDYNDAVDARKQAEMKYYREFAPDIKET